MWLSFYNQEGVSDTLLLTSGAASRYDVTIETKNGVTRVFDEKTNTVIGYNIAGISNHIRFEKAGQQFLSEEEQAIVKTLIQEAGFDGEALDLSPNVKAGQKVVVATPGTVMPNGSIIWSGELRGVESHGMLCSARELGLENAPAKKGILVLNDDAVIGEPFKG